MPTVTYVVMSRAGPFDGIENAAGSTVQTTVRRWRFDVSCSFHSEGHIAFVPDPYTATSVRAAVEQACSHAYQLAPEIGQTWTRTL